MKSRAVRLAAYVILSLFCGAARAQPSPPTIFIEDLTIAATGSPVMGAVDVYFSSADPSGTPIQGFQFEISLVGPDDDVMFSSVGAPQAHPYIFAPESSAPLFSISNGGLTATLGDFLDMGTADIATGLGLASLQFTVEPSAAGKSYMLQINTDPSASFLAADSMTFLPFTLRNGNVTVVPEPATFILALVVLPALIRRRS